MKAKSLMVLGTASGVGKSFLTAGLCRLFADRGFRVAPFKAQNMSNNSYVTEEGGEMGRAQAVQAECARVKPSVHMNPVLLKPGAEDGSQVILQGKAVGHFKARGYFNLRSQVERAIQESYEFLASNYEVIILEGAGSPAEINLKQYDLVNMSMAERAEAPCILVADIDRGGVLASVVGTLSLLEPSERDRIKGIVINKFRGDLSLFDEGVEFLEKKTGKKVWGVLPMDRSIWLEEEDAVSNHSDFSVPDQTVLDIAVIYLPYMSNFTDFEVLRHEPHVRLRYIKNPEQIKDADLLILPGTKSTVNDYLDLLKRGFREAIVEYVKKGGRLLGICGGYQMLGEWILDDQQIESKSSRVQGLGFFKMTTYFEKEKILKQIREKLNISLFGQLVQGEVQAYEIHMGKSTHEFPYASLGTTGAIHPCQKIAGTYFHGLFDSASFRKSFLDALSRDAQKTTANHCSPSLDEIKEANYFKLRQLLETHLDLSEIQQTMEIPWIEKSLYSA